MTEADDDLGKHFPARPIEVDLTGNVVTRASQAWLRDCRNNHPGCGPQDEPTLPTRVLDVLSGDGEDLVRLHISSGGQKADYLALSYCWGGPQSVVTTRQNLEAMAAGIPLAQLPQTLQDAVTVSRGLGIRYLWIDSLCILQDCWEDKAQEIGLMGKVYKNAVAVIIAGSTTAAANGFLRNRAKPKPCLATGFTAPDGTSGTICIEPLTPGSFNTMPLSRRAWCFQEYFLSNRHLFYTDRELVWQCTVLPQATVTVGSIEYPPPAYRAQFGLFYTAATKVHNTADSRAKKRLWQDILRDYTRRALTDPRDRLNAIAGVTAELSELWNDQCIFGSWKSRFTEELAWSVDGMDGLGLIERQTEFAPTWSWASMNPSVQITSGWLDEVDSDTMLVSLSEDQRTAKIVGKTLVSDQIPISTAGGTYARGQDWGYIETDLQDTEALPKDLFLLIGHDLEEVHTVLLAPTGDGSYRRIGLGVFEGAGDEIESLWSSAQKKEITLV